MSTENLGTVLVVSRFRPIYAVSILVTGIVPLLLGLDGLATNFVVPLAEGSLLRGSLFVVLAIGLVATFQAVRQLVRPQVLVEATEKGLVLHRQPGAPGGGRGAPDRLLLPWPRIAKLDYEVHALPTGIRKTRVETIAVRLLPDVEPQVPEGFSYLLEPLPGHDPNAVYVDAGSGVPGGRELLAALEEIRIRHVEGAV